MIVNPESPVYNAIIFYILIICVIIITKPEFMYCIKSNKFKSFGFGDGQTLLSFPVISIGSGIVLYIFFLFFEILHYYLLE
jgi:hypothetical protein